MLKRAVKGEDEGEICFLSIDKAAVLCDSRESSADLCSLEGACYLENCVWNSCWNLLYRFPVFAPTHNGRTKKARAVSTRMRADSHRNRLVYAGDCVGDFVCCVLLLRFGGTTLWSWNLFGAVWLDVLERAAARGV